MATRIQLPDQLTQSLTLCTPMYMFDLHLKMSHKGRFQAWNLRRLRTKWDQQLICFGMDWIGLDCLYHKYVGVLYGINVADFSQYWETLIIFIAMAFLLNIVMLNLLIAIVSDIFDQVSCVEKIWIGGVDWLDWCCCFTYTYNPQNNFLIEKNFSIFLSFSKPN